MTRRSAIIIGNKSVHPESGLSALNGPLEDASEMARVLGDPALGGFETQVLADRQSADISGVIEDDLYDMGPGDTLLIFFSGHGTLDFSGRLCLVTSDTVERKLYGTSLPINHLKDIFGNSRCGTVIVILDCCYSGAATQTKGAIRQLVQAAEEVSGLYILAGAGIVQPALEGEVKNGIYMGHFTSALIEGIESGKADKDGDGKIGLTDLLHYTRDVLQNQAPRMLASGTGDPTISLNPAFAHASFGRSLYQDLDESLLNVANRLDNWTYKNLKRIALGKISKFQRSEAFDKELRTLRDRGLIVVPKGVSALPQRGKELGVYVSSTPLGRAVVQCKEGSGHLSYHTADLFSKSMSVALVDIMRILYVLASDEAREANLARFGLFIETAKDHLSAMNSQLVLQAGYLTAVDLEMAALIERDCLWVIGQIKQRNDMNFDVVRCFSVMTRALNNAFQFFSHVMPEELAQAEHMVKTAFGTANPSGEVGSLDNIRMRHAVQSELLKGIQTIAHDVEQSHSLHYFLIDRKILCNMP